MSWFSPDKYSKEKTLKLLTFASVISNPIYKNKLERSLYALDICMSSIDIPFFYFSVHSQFITVDGNPFFNIHVQENKSLVFSEKNNIVHWEILENKIVPCKINTTSPYISPSKYRLKQSDEMYSYGTYQKVIYSFKSKYVYLYKQIFDNIYVVYEDENNKWRYTCFSPEKETSIDLLIEEPTITTIKFFRGRLYKVKQTNNDYILFDVFDITGFKYTRKIIKNVVRNYYEPFENLCFYENFYIKYSPSEITFYEYLK